MGCGRLGATLAVSLSEEGWFIHILDLNSDTFDRLPPGMIENGHIVPIVGDGTLARDLRKASTQDADVFIAVSGRDTRNALAAQLAKHILNVPNVICRMNDQTRRDMYEELGLTTISPVSIVTQMTLAAVRG
jgi:trk system potassium uptake protein TrkA